MRWTSISAMDASGLPAAAPVHQIRQREVQTGEPPSPFLTYIRRLRFPFWRAHTLHGATMVTPQQVLLFGQSQGHVLQTVVMTRLSQAHNAQEIVRGDEHAPEKRTLPKCLRCPCGHLMAIATALKWRLTRRCPRSLHSWRKSSAWRSGPRIACLPAVQGMQLPSTSRSRRMSGSGSIMVQSKKVEWTLGTTRQVLNRQLFSSWQTCRLPLS